MIQSAPLPLGGGAGLFERHQRSGRVGPNRMSAGRHKAATSFIRRSHCFTDGGWDMANDVVELDQMQANYKAAVEEWIAAIKQEEALASVNHNVAEVDKWEAAHFSEDALRNKVKAAKKQYEDALREKFFGF
jgi:hypothetical protein